MTAAPIDLRSDTVTRPTAGMRAAMAAAEVGDDVLGEDPTVRALEVRAAALVGKEAALFVPSGTMANQIALKLHCAPGDDVLVGEGAHLFGSESGAGAAIAGVQFTVIGRGGLFGPDDLLAACAPAGGLVQPPTRLVCVENTHNRGGGRCWPAGLLAGVAAAARGRGLALHLDGARLLNAAIAAGAAPAALGAPFDTVSLAFSKGLGAPVGSVLAGPEGLVARGRRVRKMLGGGMRQAGILAAGALYALDHHVARLADDHANARRLAEALGHIDGLAVDAAGVETNIVLVDLAPQLPDAAAAAVALAARGVLCLSFGARRLRFVTHLDVDAAACDRAAAVVREALATA